MEDFQKIIESLTPEQREKMEAELSLKREDLIAKRAKEFELELLGEVEIEESVVYDFEYFKNLYEKKGMAFLKEEMAKVPKEEREELTQKIVEHYKAKNQLQSKKEE